MVEVKKDSNLVKINVGLNSRLVTIFVIMILLGLISYNINRYKNDKIFALIFAGLSFIVTAYLIYTFYKNKIIVIDKQKNELKIGGKLIYINEIKSIEKKELVLLRWDFRWLKIYKVKINLDGGDSFLYPSSYRYTFPINTIIDDVMGALEKELSLKNYK